ncbi:type II asparaginase [Peribacillus frigoritolerans]|uniref:type II asparaginase n=1 Tax=Peribacillus frigoritolerans TaxID=450367 RepID=UPI0022319B32|nr:type II asparaginase [Peribacillus frigoritolerans]MDM5309902.1 type II asparaginase [Peribacillus frigoritolerans]UZD48556.1 type II asparaginase [Peribacillus frigoritolerans]WHX63644.1 type II asparaginase [Peribacillus frigoritolerans]
MNIKKYLGITFLLVTLLFSGSITVIHSSANSNLKEEKVEATSTNPKLNNVKIIATGGTIAGSATSNTDTTGYQPGALGVETLIKAVPELKQVANVSGEQIANIGSNNMDNKTLLKLAKRINELLKSKDVDGIVVTHGTDTLEETAYFLNLVVKSNKPVVIVGSMRPATAISADGPLNLYNAVKIAASKDAKNKGVLISLNDRIGSARYITKTNTTMTDTFQSEEQGYLGAIAGNKVFFYNEPTRKHTTKSVFDVSKLDKLPLVDIIYSYQNDSRYFYDAAVKAGAKGIIIAGEGNGLTSDTAFEGAKDAVKKGVIITRSSRVGNGIVTREKIDDENNFVTADSLNPQKARILTMLALTKTDDPKEIQQFFNEY